MDVKVVWEEGMELTGYSESGHQITLDASEKSGGQNKGFLPIELLAVGTAGCASLDVIAIMRKKKVQFTGYECNVHVESYQEDHLTSSRKCILNMSLLATTSRIKMWSGQCSLPRKNTARLLP